MRILAYLRNLFRKRHVDEDLDAEVRSYAEMLAEEKMRDGMNPQGAKREARIELGGVEQVKERVREARAGAYIDSLLQDIRYGARLLRKNPGFTFVTVLTLALGIGANTAMYSFVDAALFKPPPVKSPGEIVNIYSTEAKDESGFNYAPLSYPDYKDFRDQSLSFAGLIGYAQNGVAIEGSEDSEIIPAEVVTENYFYALGVKPVIGRTFDPAPNHAPGDNPEAVLSYRLWQRKFGAAPGIIGRKLLLNGNSVEVVGVAPPEFLGLFRGISPDIWLPIMTDSALHLGDPVEDRGSQWLWTAGRLRPGVPTAQAQSELATIAAQLEKAYPKSNKDRSAKVFRADNVKILPDIDAAVSATAYVLLGFVGLVLLIVCANLSGIFLARASSRRKEIAVRMALGAGRLRLIRQMLTESILLSALGGVCALVLTAAFNRGLTRLLSGTMPLPIPVHFALGLDLNMRVLVYTAAMGVGATLSFGLIPALRISRGTLPSALQEETGKSTVSRRKHRTLGALVVAQVAISLLLLICAGLSVRSLLNANRVNPGFEASGVATASFVPSATGYTDAQVNTFYRQLAERVQALPNVSSVSFTERIPLTFAIQISAIAPQGQDTGPLETWSHVDRGSVGPGYFQTMRIPIMKGREFNEQDTATSPLVAIVNEILANRFWPGQDAVGRKIRFGEDEHYYEVVGIAHDGKYRTLGESPRPFAYRPLAQGQNHDYILLARVSGDPRPMLAAIRGEARALDARMPVMTLQTLEQRTSVSLLLPRAAGALFGLFGVLGLILASVGLYGVISYTASQRTHEIGIRMALGARPSEILQLIVRQGLMLTLTGVLIGTAAALVVTRVLSVMLYGISAQDPATFVGVSLLLIFIALVACYVPARRAIKVDPMVALRYE
jgi:macrolide transport system ATP-binding/permease protein